MIKTPVIIEVTITNSCNCNCAYCFEPTHFCSIDIEEQTRQLTLIEDYCKTFDTEKHSYILLSFWGGEPTLNIDFIHQLVTATSKYEFVRYSMYTNGTMPDKISAFIDIIKTNFVVDRTHVQLSYDGEPHHKMLRGYSSDKVLQSARLLKAANIDIAFKATLTYENVKLLPDIWKSYELLYNEFNNILYSPTLDTTNLGDDKYFDDWKAALNTIIKYEYDFIKKHNRPLMTWFANNTKLNCNISNTININNDGKIYVCHGCPYTKNSEIFVLNTTKGIKHLSEVLNSYMIYENAICEKCYATYCAVCHAATLENSSNPLIEWCDNKPNNFFRCKYYKYFGYISRVLKFLVMVK